MSSEILLSILKNDLLGNILAHAADLEACSAYISLQLREIIAARVVALCERLPDGDYRLVAACPERRAPFLAEPECRRLIQQAAACAEPTMFVPGEEGPGQLLADLELGRSFVVPLTVDKDNYGVLLLLDLMDDKGMHHILEALRGLSGLLSLIFKTSYLYRNLERLAEERSLALLASERRSAQILQTAMDGFWCLDHHGQIIEVNEAYCQMSGYSRQEMLSMSIINLESAHQPAEIAKNLARVLAGEHLRFESVHRKKCGAPLHVEISVQRRQGKEEEMFAFIRDIGERKKGEAEREQLQRRLQQAEKMEAIGTLAGGIAHDFNNILGAVIGYTELAQDDASRGLPLNDDLAQILKAANRAKELVKQILDFSRQSATEPVPLMPVPLIKEAVKLLRSSLPTTIAIDLRLDPQAGPILADPAQLHQIVMNLGTNALHAMEQQGGTLTVIAENVTLDGTGSGPAASLPPGPYVRLAVADSGAGIAPDVRERIFEPYFTTKEVGKGTGMGLAIVHGIAERCRGLVYGDNRPEGGAIFTLLLPQAMEKPQPLVELEEKAAAGGEHILLVDDEEMLVQMGKQLLQRLGYRVTTRTSSLEAPTTFHNQPDLFDLVITDQTMSGMTGVDLARRLLQLRPSLPIILCTGYSNQISAEETRRLGIAGFAFKPLTRRDMAGLIRQVLDQRRR